MACSTTAAELLTRKGARQATPFPRGFSDTSSCGVVGKLGQAQPREEGHAPWQRCTRRGNSSLKTGHLSPASRAEEMAADVDAQSPVGQAVVDARDAWKARGALPDARGIRPHSTIPLNNTPLHDQSRHPPAQIPSLRPTHWLLRLYRPLVSSMS
jgi:hypothetical protein